MRLGLVGNHRLTGGPIVTFNTVAFAEAPTSFLTVMESGGLASAGVGLASFGADDAAELQINGLRLETEANLFTGGVSPDPNLASRGPARVLVNGPITANGNHRIRVTATKPGGRVDFSRANTFSGQVDIKEGAVLRITHSGALGTTAGDTTVQRDGALEIVLAQSAAIAEPFALPGGTLRILPSSGGPNTLTLSGRVDSRFAGTAGTRIELNGALALTGEAVGSLTVRGPNRVLTLGGAASNSLQLDSDADLVLAKPAGIPALATLTLQSGAVATWTADRQLGDTMNRRTSVKLTNATLELGSHSDATAGLTLSSSSLVNIAAGGRLGAFSLHSTNADGAVPNRIAGAGMLEIGSNRRVSLSSRMEVACPMVPKDATSSLRISTEGQDSHRLIVSGISTVDLVLQSGAVEVNSNSPSADIRFDDGSFATSTLFGSGTVGTITGDAQAHGIISPGGISGGVGQLRCGSVTLTPNLALRADLAGTVPGTGHDQLTVTGTVDLANADLVVSFAGFSPAAGTSFTIISNDGTDAVTGTFAGLPQGATILGGRFSISYIGGSGNDVTITALSVPSGVTRTWTGLGTSDFWSTAQNWSPVGAPQNGDALVFPSGAARRTNFNDRSNLGVQSISITGGPYAIGGNAIGLANGITVSGPVLLNHSVQLALNLTGAQTIAVGPHFLNLGGALNTNGMALTFSAQGTPGVSTITCAGIISEGVGDQFVKTGGGVLSLTRANTTRGNFHIRQGVVRITNSAALGSRLGATIVDEGAQLLVAGTDLALNEPIQLAGTLNIADNAGAPGFGDPLDCAATARLFVSATGVTQCNYFDEIRGIALTKTGPGILNLTGAKTKSLSQGITIDEGRVVATGTAGTILLPGDTTVGVDPARGAILEIKQRRVTEADSELIVNEGGTVICDSPEIAFARLTLKGGTVSTDSNGFALNGPLTTLASSSAAVLTGRITLPQGTSDWNIADGAAAVDLRVDALLREEVSIDALVRKAGAGSTVFTAANSLDAATFQNGNNTWNSLSNFTKVTVTGGTLFGTGRSPYLAARDSGVIAPGNSPGLLTAGTLNLELGGTLHFELNGTTPGSGHDQIRCTDDPAVVNLGGARLTLAQGFTPVPGTVLTLIDIEGAGNAIPFPSLPEGATALAGSQRYRISYRGGSGNDITLTALPPVPTSPLRITGFSVIDGPPAQGQRTLAGTISGGPGAAGLGIQLELSENLQSWSSFPIRIADENGNLPFTHAVGIDNAPEFFLRGRVP